MSKKLAKKLAKLWQKKADKKKKSSEKIANRPTKVRPGSFHDRHPSLIRAFEIVLFPLINPVARYVLLGLGAVFIIITLLLMQQLPSPRKLTTSEEYAVSTQIFDRNHKLLYEIYADENRIPITLEKVPEHVVQATLAIEDKNFYRHWGIDLWGIIRAMRNNLKDDTLQGGSTITQQLVKNALLSRERTWTRKAKEAYLAILTEILYSKDEILEMYLNYISYGGTAVGIEAAAHKYFDKSATQLTLSEASLLAALPQAPTLYSPFGAHPEKGQQRQADVLRRMKEDGYITAEQEEQAKSESLKFALSQTEIKAPHFVFYVRDQLYQEYGEKKVETGGLRVHTSLDLDLQEAAQASVSAEIAQLGRYKVSNGAAVITKPNTGEILAMVGSKDYFDTENDGQVNVTLALRQPGSSIKPLMYATTFQQKTLNPGTILLDNPTCFEVPGQKPYCPRNYDGGFKGPVSIRQSLGSSLNIPAVKSLSTIGVKTFMDQAKKAGISTWDDPANYGLSLTLGGGEVKMLDMAQAYGVLANQGIKVPLISILKVEDYQGEVLTEVDLEERKEQLNYLNNYENNGQKGELKRVMDRAPAYLVSHIMQDNNARLMAFGPNSQLVIPNKVVSAKTGTTNNLKDNWTLGFTPQYLVITWVGNNNGDPMSYLASGVTGAAPIWNDLMSYILKDKESVWPEKPPDVTSAPVCVSGMPPEVTAKKLGFNCEPIGTDYYWEASEPSFSRLVKENVWINPETGVPPEPGQHVEGLILEERVLYKDPVTQGLGYCYDCSRKTDPEGKVIYEQNRVLFDGQGNIIEQTNQAPQE
ncbi:MAG: PBP1A family penicillin-binding protein [Candidatus Pacebacteria bacterium]|nr:PBP1A family penicillin-binding protein [Candidatus Paceibacterota bacterium]